MDFENIKIPTNEVEYKVTREDMMREFLLKRDEEMQNLTAAFVERLLNIKLEIKNLNSDIKALKREAKLNGVSVQKVCRALSQIEKEYKKSDEDKFEEELYYEYFKEGEKSAKARSLVRRLAEKE